MSQTSRQGIQPEIGNLNIDTARDIGVLYLSHPVVVQRVRTIPVRGQIERQGRRDQTVKPELSRYTLKVLVHQGGIVRLADREDQAIKALFTRSCTDVSICNHYRFCW